jgi:hypothetical protein
MAPASAAITAEEYIRLPPPLKLAFVAGALDAWEKVLGIEHEERVQSKFGELMKHNFSCLNRWGSDDYRNALDAYLKENESQAKYGATSALLNMIAALCSK